MVNVCAAKDKRLILFRRYEATRIMCYRGYVCMWRPKCFSSNRNPPSRVILVQYSN